jgi:hypothetical protein
MRFLTRNGRGLGALRVAGDWAPALAGDGAPPRAGAWSAHRRPGPDRRPRGPGGPGRWNPIDPEADGPAAGLAAGPVRAAGPAALAAEGGGHWGRRGGSGDSDGSRASESPGPDAWPACCQ